MYLRAYMMTWNVANTYYFIIYISWGFFCQNCSGPGSDRGMQLSNHKSRHLGDFSIILITMKHLLKWRRVGKTHALHVSITLEVGVYHVSITLEVGVYHVSITLEVGVYHVSMSMV